MFSVSITHNSKISELSDENWITDHESWSPNKCSSVSPASLDHELWKQDDITQNFPNPNITYCPAHDFFCFLKHQQKAFSCHFLCSFKSNLFVLCSSFGNSNQTYGGQSINKLLINRNYNVCSGMHILFLHFKIFEQQIIGNKIAYFTLQMHLCSCLLAMWQFLLVN